ncbi:hypothetical protein [Nocardia bhagyanarayanae]|uniref:hypothetical protein n=1 Tax=Nocardia bhagyanarayanae TaxID=1215925 RepID=UPI00163AA874|nr:hypothetical protein [Nocardia bhagyanarayanae]
MVDSGRLDGQPRSAVAVGAGIVGRSTPGFLRERGVQLTAVTARRAERLLRKLPQAA